MDIAFRHRLSHLSSSLPTAGILCDIYEQRTENEPVILSNGHAGLALYVLLEAVYGLDAEDLERRHGTHPIRSESDKIYLTTGSLGMGLPIALGMAFADRTRRVFCVISDGECAEGSIWESLAVKTKYGVDNLQVFANLNGYSAYDQVDTTLLTTRLRTFDPLMKICVKALCLPFALGCAAHYHVLTDDEHCWLLDHIEEVV